MTLSSDDMRRRISALEKELSEMEAVLCEKGQFVAACELNQAIGQLRKTRSVWNHAINWPAQCGAK